MKFPDCPHDREDCQFECSGESSTLLAYVPRYNREGENLNPDNNKVAGSVRCVKCDTAWSYSYRKAEKEKTFKFGKPVKTAKQNRGVIQDDPVIIKGHSKHF